MKEFKCSRCGESSSQSSSNYVYQMKRFGELICKSCMKSIKSDKLSSLMTAKYMHFKKNNDIVVICCDICGKEKKLTRRAVKNGYTTCKSCAAKKSRQLNRNKYMEASKNRINNSKFASLVSAGMLQLPTEIRQANAKLASMYWSDPLQKSEVLSRRDTEEYRAAISAGLNRPEVKEKLRENAKKHWKAQWQIPEFREKMAEIRSMQSHTTSKLNKSLYSHLDDMGVDYVKEHNIGPWCFDCFLPDYNILVECQGDYWHSLPKAIRNDRAKATYINKYFPHFRILYIFEHDFDTKDYVLHRLKYELGITQLTEKHINFSDVAMEQVNAAAINEFMYKYHYIGPRSHAINLAFYFQHQIIAGCSYSGVSRRETAIRLGYDSNEVMELCRFCIHPNFHQKNFASWCISNSIRWVIANKPKCKCLVAFADPSLNHNGTIYKASNWQYDGMSETSYYYINNENFVMHKKTLYNNAVKNNMTEALYASKFGYEKRHTDGKHRFIYKLD